MTVGPPLFFAFFASSGVWRFSVGRSGSSASAGAEPLAVVDPVVVVLSGVERFMVGRSGSSAGVLPVCVVEGVVVSLRRFIVGRSGSSAGVDVLLVVEPVVEPVEPGLAGGVLDAVVVVPESAVSELRRFMVGRFGSSLVDGLVVPAVVVVSGLVFVGVAGLL